MSTLSVLAKTLPASKLYLRLTKEALLALPEEEQRLLLGFKLDVKSERLLVLHGAKNVAWEVAQRDDRLKGKYMARDDVTIEELQEVADCGSIIEAILWSRALLGEEKLYALWRRSIDLGCAEEIADVLVGQASIKFVVKHFDELFPYSTPESLQDLLRYKTLPLEQAKKIVNVLSPRECKSLLSEPQNIRDEIRGLLQERMF